MESSTVELLPLEVRVTRYVCPYCRRGRSARKPCLEHMSRCWKNPDLRGCRTCALFQSPGWGATKPVAGARGPGRCGAGYNIAPGLVTSCKKWQPLPEKTA